MRISDWSSDVCSSDLLGFDHFERTLDRVAKMSAEGYPPYNIEQIGAARLRITLAVAGFGESDLSIRIEDNQLVVRGKQREEGERLYLHRGIAHSRFPATLSLADRPAILATAIDKGLHHYHSAPTPPCP